MNKINYTFQDISTSTLIRFLWRATNPNCLYSKEFKIAIRNELLRRKEALR